MRNRGYVVTSAVLASAVVGVLLGTVVHSATYMPRAPEPKAATLVNCSSAISRDRGVFTGTSFELKHLAGCINGSGTGCAITGNFTIYTWGGAVMMNWISTYNLECQTGTAAHRFGPWDVGNFGFPPGFYWLGYTIQGTNSSGLLEDLVLFTIY